MAVLDAIPAGPGAEVTVECNPEDAAPDRLAAYRAGGVTRLSLGVQSTVPHVLAGLGRRHGTGQVFEAAAAVAAAGFASWNMDLIFGGAGETDGDWERSLDDVLGLAVAAPARERLLPDGGAGHPAGRRPRPPPRRRHPGRPLRPGRRRLGEAGYRWEEISNWARPGHECRHNGLYWSQGDYRGIGSAAHSHRAGRRWWNVRTPDRYVAASPPGRRPPPGRRCSPTGSGASRPWPSPLRTRAGVPVEALPAHPDLEGLVDRRDGRAVLTVRGRLLANAVTTRLVAGADVGAGVGGTSRYDFPDA